MPAAFLPRATLLAAALLVGGCGLFGAVADDEFDDAHAVFLTDPACRAVVVKTQGNGFAVLAPAGPRILQRGDLLAGSLRRGQTALQVMPFPEQSLGPTEPFTVHAAGLDLAEAQAVWRMACPNPGEPTI